MKKVRIELCVGTSCHMLGSADLSLVVDLLQQEYEEQVEVGYCTCLGACAKGPNVKVNGKVLSEVTPEKLKTEVVNILSA